MDKKLKAGAIYNPDGLHRNRIFSEDPPSYLWCLHCERGYPYGEYREVGDLQMCPYSDCDGDTVIDGWDWNKVREGNADYPDIPNEGVVYPSYGK